MPANQKYQKNKIKNHKEDAFQSEKLEDMEQSQNQIPILNQNNQEQIINEQLLIEQYKQSVLKKMIKSLAILMLISFAIFIVIKIILTYNKLKSIEQQETIYLSKLMKLHLINIQKDNAYIFSYLDNVAAILSFGVSSTDTFNKSLNNFCNSNESIFLCRNQTSQTNLYSYIYDRFSLIQIQLSDAINNLNYVHTFIFNQKFQIVQFNATGLYEQSQNAVNQSSNNLDFSYKQIQNMIDYITSLNQTVDTSIASYLTTNNQSESQYIWLGVVQDQNNYELICGDYTPYTSDFKSKGYVCIILQVNKNLSNVNNILYYKSWVQTIALYNDSIQIIAQPDTELDSLYAVFSDFITSEVLPLYPQFALDDQQYMLQCLQFHDQFYEIFFQETVQYEIFRCFNSYIHFLMPKHLFQWALVKVNKLSSTAILTRSQKIDDFKLQFFILSNSTYYENGHNQIVLNLFQMEYLIKIVLLITLIVMFFINSSMKIVLDNTIYSFKIIQKLAKLIKNSQNSINAQQEFQRVIKQLPQKKIPIFQNIIYYFKKFLWIKKLYSSKFSFKKRAILMEGLKYFKYEGDRLNQNQNMLQDQNILRNYRTYPAVLMYIYAEVINLEMKKIQKLKSLKVIPAKRRKSKDQTQLNILKELQDQPEQNIQKQQFQKQQTQNINFSPQVYINKHRKNRGVRFSNQVQLNQMDKKSKLRRDVGSNSTLGKKSSLKSVKSIQSQIKKRIDQFQKSSKSEEDSGFITSKKLKKQTTINKILNGQQSVHQGLRSIKFDQTEDNDNNKSGQEEQENQIKFQIGSYSSSQIAQQMLKCYVKVIQHYQCMIDIKILQFQNKLLDREDKNKQANSIYSLQIQRFIMCSKFLKIATKYNIQIDQQIQISFQFTLLQELQELFQIQIELLQKASICKMRISVFLGNSISFKELQNLSNSQIINSKLQANYLYAQQLAQLSPHLDLQVINKCCDVICDYQTTFTYKKKNIDILIKVLQKTQTFNKQIQQLELIKRFYNKKHKKFNFIADMSQSYDIFTPLLNKFYELMNSMDLIQIFNLGMNDSIDEMKLTRQILKPVKVQAFLSLFEQLTFENDKSKEKISSKLIHPKFVIQKDFNQILSEIQKDETQFSTYIVVILGADTLLNQTTMDDETNSSNNQRQQSQYLYSQINRKLKQNYFHVIVIGQNLQNFQTKQGKIKKHLKSCFQLFEIDLTKSTLNQHYYQLQKFLNH